MADGKGEEEEESVPLSFKLSKKDYAIYERVATRIEDMVGINHADSNKSKKIRAIILLCDAVTEEMAKRPHGAGAWTSFKNYIGWRGWTGKGTTLTEANAPVYLAFGRTVKELKEMNKEEIEKAEGEEEKIREREATTV